MRNKRPPKECCDKGCDHIVMQRNRYFTGKYMTARDFAGEQEYFLSRHRLHNRILHGWGIVCGLEVAYHKSPDCKETWVVVSPGIAIDCCGRELILPKTAYYKLPLPEGDSVQRTGADSTQDIPDSGGSERQERQEEQYEAKTESESTEEDENTSDTGFKEGSFLLCLSYYEDEIEHVPALYAESMCDPTRSEANRVSEMACLGISYLDEVEGDCWPIPGGDRDIRCRDDCEDSGNDYLPDCLNAVCPCKGCVPLALIEPMDPEYSGGPRFRLLIEGRRSMNTPPDYLTHIVHTNWKHGETISIDRLRRPADDRNGLDGRLEVWFDRNILPRRGDATGISPLTFVVQYGGTQRDVEFLPYNPDDVETQPHLVDECRAIFPIRPDLLAGRNTIVDNMVYVTLKCDFIIDSHGKSVDGNHLKGCLPSGNGTEGGIFESWFYVSPYGQSEGGEAI